MSGSDAMVPGPGNVLNRIAEFSHRLRPSEQKVAARVLEDPKAVVRMTLAELAKSSQVSEPTIVRFANGIGCDGFHDFRIQLAQSVALGIPATQSVINKDDDTTTTIVKVFDYTISSLDHARRHLDTQQIERAVTALSSCRSILFIGLGASGIVAQDAQQKFPLFGVPCTAPIDHHQQFLAGSVADSDTVVVAISNVGRTQTILHTVHVAREGGATIIGISGGATPLAQLSDIPIIVESLDNTDVYTPTISRIAQLVVIDVLATSVMIRRDDDALRALRRIKQRLARMRAGLPYEMPELGTPY